MEFMTKYTGIDLFWIGLSLFLIGVSKGGFPVGSIAVPLLILVWPQQAQSARAAVGFMLPMLCVMDAVALLFYWRNAEWHRIKHLLPAALAGVTIGSLLFVSDESALIAISDRALKMCIGVLGVLFVLYFAAKKWIFRHLDSVANPSWGKGSVFGLVAGLTSTLAHAAGPVMQMYLLPQHLPKKQFVGTKCLFFWILNLSKIVPFVLLRRIQPESLKLGAVMFPVIPIGVALGWWLVHRTHQKQYNLLVYAVLLVASITLIAKAL